MIQCYTALPICLLDSSSKEVQRNTEFKESLLFGEAWTVVFPYLKAKIYENMSGIKPVTLSISLVILIKGIMLLNHIKMLGNLIP